MTRVLLMTIPDRPWARPPALPALSGDEIHVWRAPLRMPTSYTRQLAKILSPDERARADQFCFKQDRDRFIACRGLLRVILGHYLGAEPSRLQFCYGAWGKPALSETLSGEGLRFNLSHSGELALFAVARDREIGIDLERVRPMPALEQLTERILSGREKAHLRALLPGQQQAFFFKCWTCKEAYAKARGEGLRQPFDRVEVSTVPGEPPRLLSIAGSSLEAAFWSLYELTPATGYVASLVVEGQGCKLGCWQWPEG